MAVKIADLFKAPVDGQPMGMMSASVNINIQKVENGLVVNIQGKQYAFEGVAADASALATSIKALLTAEITA